MKSWALACLVTGLASLAACGGSGNSTDAAGSGSGGDGGGIDAPSSSVCDPQGPQCSNCIDDDGDGRIDGFDPECTGAADDDEATFGTGIPGDNMDPVMQDCFFDGDSGAGNDGCNIHVCCLLGAQTVADCPIGANRYHPDECPPPIGTGTISQQCIDTCGPLTPPGCDCFGCCTICDPDTDQCYDIDINLLDSTGCTPETLADPTKCLRCVKNDQCGYTGCGGETCILCPGEDPNDLPPDCNGAVCPTGVTACPTGSGCPDATYCSNGCCVGVIQ
jgi:hypothetical protein